MTLPTEPIEPAEVETPETPEVESKELSPSELKAALAAARKEAASFRTKLREAEPFVTKARELEEAQKSDVEKLTALHTSAQARADAAEAQLGQIEAARAAGLDLDMADRIRGNTKEEREADAKKLAEKFGSKVANDPGRKPRTRLSESTPVPSEAGEDDESPGSLAARVRAKRRF